MSQTTDQIRDTLTSPTPQNNSIQLSQLRQVPQVGYLIRLTPLKLLSTPTPLKLSLLGPLHLLSTVSDSPFKYFHCSRLSLLQPLFPFNYILHRSPQTNACSYILFRPYHSVRLQESARICSCEHFLVARLPRSCSAMRTPRSEHESKQTSGVCVCVCVFYVCVKWGGRRGRKHFLVVSSS